MTLSATIEILPCKGSEGSSVRMRGSDHDCENGWLSIYVLYSYGRDFERVARRIRA